MANFLQQTFRAILGEGPVAIRKPKRALNEKPSHALKQYKQNTRLRSAPDLEKDAQRLLHEIGCDALAKKVRVCWNSALQTTAGTANYSLTLISLSPVLVAFGEAEIARTLRHELAHLVAQFRVGRKRIQPHGVAWKRACADLGIGDEKRCHTLPLPRRKVARRYIYRCPVCADEIRRVHPFRRRVACLACCRKHNHGRYDERFRLEKIVAFNAKVKH